MLMKLLDWWKNLKKKLKKQCKKQETHIVFFDWYFLNNLIIFFKILKEKVKADALSIIY